MAELEAHSVAADFWDDASRAEDTLRRLSECKVIVEQACRWEATISDASVAIARTSAKSSMFGLGLRDRAG